MDIVAIALFVSLVGNIIQMTFYIVNVYMNYRKYTAEKEEMKRRDSYNDLQETNGIYL